MVWCYLHSQVKHAHCTWLMSEILVDLAFSWSLSSIFLLSDYHNTHELIKQRTFIDVWHNHMLESRIRGHFSHSHNGKFVIIFKSGSGKRLISRVGAWAQPRFHFYVCDRIGIVLLSAFCQGWGRLRIGNVIITRPHTIRQVQMETQLQIHQH